MLKKLYIVIVSLFLFLFFVLNVARAQKFRVGLINGPHLSTTTWFYTHQSRSLLLSWHWGLMGNLGVSDYLSVQPEVLWVRKGTSFEMIGGFKMKYIEFPLSIKYDFNLTKNISLYANLGGYFATFINSPANYIPFIYSYDMTSLNIRTYDIGVFTGSGISINRFAVDYRMEIGCIDRDKHIQPVNKLTDKSLNIVFYVSFIYFVNR